MSGDLPMWLGFDDGDQKSAAERLAGTHVLDDKRNCHATQDFDAAKVFGVQGSVFRIEDRPGHLDCLLSSLSTEHRTPNTEHSPEPANPARDGTSA